jgi:hypothetical protein
MLMLVSVGSRDCAIIMVRWGISLDLAHSRLRRGRTPPCSCASHFSRWSPRGRTYHC